MKGYFNSDSHPLGTHVGPITSNKTEDSKVERERGVWVWVWGGGGEGGRYSDFSWVLSICVRHL